MCGRKIKKRIDLNSLPIRNNNIDKDRYIIDWVKAIGHKVNFTYDDVIGEVEIISYKNGKLIVKYSENDLFEIYPENFKKCKLGKLLNKTTVDFKIEIGQTFKDDKRDITIIDREYIKNENGQNLKYYKYKCNKCGFKHFILEGNLINQKMVVRYVVRVHK